MLEDLQQLCRDEGLFDVDLSSRYTTATENAKIREYLGLDIPRIDNLSSIFGSNGKVYAVRYDLTKEVDNHKKLMSAGLILRNVLLNRLPRPNIDTLIDGGNYNSAIALRHYTKKFGMRGIYVTSRLMPDDMVNDIESNWFKVVRAPPRESVSIAREFYSYLYDVMKNKVSDPSIDSSRSYCLWHAKYSGIVMKPFGREIAKSSPPVDSIVSSVGAGSTLEGLQLPFQDLRDCEIIVAEHELSPLFVNFKPVVDYDTLKGNFENNHFTLDSLPHFVIGPHWQEINPLIPQRAIDRVAQVVKYNDADWKIVQKKLSDAGINVGNSSAANVAAAVKIANTGKSVMTVIFEPRRWFYKKR